MRKWILLPVQGSAIPVPRPFGRGAWHTRPGNTLFFSDSHSAFISCPKVLQICIREAKLSFTHKTHDNLSSSSTYMSFWSLSKNIFNTFCCTNMPSLFCSVYSSAVFRIDNETFSILFSPLTPHRMTLTSSQPSKPLLLILCPSLQSLFVQFKELFSL